MTCPKCGHQWVPAGSRPRSTGRGSQSAHLHGHLQQIGAHTGYTLEEIKDVMKADLLDWPRREIVFQGKAYLRPISEADATAAVESAAIEWCHMRASELGITLREGT